MARKFDCYVFSTECMAGALGVAHKPYAIVEGMHSMPKDNTLIETQSDPNLKIIFNAGALREEYGIPHLLRAFEGISDQNYRLWLAGGGPSEALIRKYAEKDSRIRFFGFITPEEVYKLQQMSTVLISPRLPEMEFVKYSFASKTFESLASGKPYIAHRLPCDPPEYGKHIQYAEANTDEALRNKIVEICEMSQTDRDLIGQQAKKFIAEEKNPQVMCKRITDMFYAVCSPLEL